MKKTLFAVLILAFALVAPGCSGGGSGGGAGSPYYGTSWEAAGGSTLSFVSDTEWQMTAGDGSATKGTYTYRGGSITLTPTHARADSGAAWTAIPPGSAASAPIAASVSGDSLAVNGEVFGKQDGGAGAAVKPNPYNGTVWEEAYTGMTISFVSDTEYQTGADDGGLIFKGTYTYSASGSSITITITHFNYNLGAGWEPFTDPQEPSIVSVLGNTFVLNSTYLYIKQGGGGQGGGPYYGTTWRGAGGNLFFLSDDEWQIRESDGTATKGTYTYSASGSSILFTTTHKSADYGVAWTLAEGEPPSSGIALGDGIALDGDVFVERRGDSPYCGTSWEAANGTAFSFMSDTDWLMFTPGPLVYKGTYVYDPVGKTITLTPTDMTFDSGAKWRPADVLGPEAMLVKDDALEFAGVVYTKRN